MPVQVAMPYLEDEGRNRTISSYGQEYSPVYVENMKRYLGEKLGEIRRYNRGETDPLEMPIGYDVGPFAMIKGKDPQVVKILRGLMAEENRARGAMPGSDIESKVLRGTWYRGQRTIPEPIATPEGSLMTSFRREGVETTIPGPPVFSMARTSALKVGEPSGVSISAKPSVASGFAKWGEGEQELLQGARDEAFESIHNILEKHSSSAKYYEIADQITNPEFKSKFVTGELDRIRANNPDDYNKLIEDTKRWKEMVDRLGAGPPIARVMPMYGGVPEEKILRISNPEHQEVIKSSYEEALKKFLGEDPEAMNRIAGYGGRPPTRSKFLEQLRYDDALRKKFNDILTSNMQEKGYKGLLYTPQRYNEFELKMFDPKDIMALDVRRVDDPTLSKLFKSYYDDPTLSKLFKSYYDEPIGKGAKKLGEWTEASYGKPAHLKELYRDIDVDSILKNLYEARYEGKSMQELEKKPFKLDPSNKPDAEVIGPKPDLNFDLGGFKPNKVQKLYLDKIDPDGSYSSKEQEAAVNYLLDAGYGEVSSGEVPDWMYKETKLVIDKMFGKDVDEIFTPNWSQFIDWVNGDAGVKESKEIVSLAKKLKWTEDNILSMDSDQLENIIGIYNNKVMKKMLLGE